MSRMLEAALEYAKIGWPVFPCGYDKSPLTTNGCLDATTDPNKIAEWWSRTPDANIGFHCGAAGLVAVDLDPGHVMSEVHAAFGGLPDTAMSQTTPRGGSHRFYTLAEGETVAPSNSKLAKGMDIKSHNSYVLLAPSETKDGAYCWNHWPPMEMPKPTFRSEGMMLAFAKATPKHKNADVWLIEPDIKEHVEQAIDWIESDKCQPASQGQGGNTMTYKTATMMRSYGLSEDMALHVMAEVYNAKCFPPWELHEMAPVVRNGYRYAGSPPGNATAAYKKAHVLSMLKAIEPTRTAADGIRQQLGRFVIVDPTADDLTPDPEWLIPELLQCSTYAMMVGRPGSFKTFLALDIALSVAVGDGDETGRMWPAVKRPGAVMFAAGEGGAGVKLRRRAWEFLHHGGKPVPNFFRASAVPQITNETDALSFVEVAKAAHPAGYRMVVIDTAMRAMQGQNSNSQEAASALTKLVSMIATELSPDEYGCTVLVLHHPGQGQGAGDRPAGSFVFVGDPDTLLLVEREGKSMTVGLRMTKQKDAEEWEEPRYVALSTVGKSLAAVAGATPPKTAKPPEPIKEANPFQKQGGRAAAVAHERIQKAIEDELACNPAKQFSGQELANLAAHRLAREQSGDGVTINAIRTTNLKRMIEAGHPAFQGRGWRHATKH